MLTKIKKKLKIKEVNTTESMPFFKGGSCEYFITSIFFFSFTRKKRLSILLSSVYGSIFQWKFKILTGTYERRNYAILKENYIELTTREVIVMDINIFGILQMYSIRVYAIPRRRDADIIHCDWFAIIKFQVALWAILYCYSWYSHIVAPIKPQSLYEKYKN